MEIIRVSRIMNAERGNNKSTSVSSVFSLPTLYFIPPPIDQQRGKLLGAFIHAGSQTGSRQLKEGSRRRLRATRFHTHQQGRDDLQQDQTHVTVVQ